MDDVRPDDVPGTDAWRESIEAVRWDEYLDALADEAEAVASAS